ncbi:MAG: YceI family protein [Flavobacteriales bacterium]|nr:YceI family protein [Flavobacteriales bacterium]
MKHISIILMTAIFLSSAAFNPIAIGSEEDKVITKTGHISFFSHTVAEDITANNYKVMSALTLSTGAIVFSVPMQSFEFEKSLMQKHYNSPKFLDTKTYPKAKFKGKIDGKVPDLSKNGKYEVSITGDLTIHGVTKKVTEQGVIEVSNGSIKATSKFTVVLADYKIAFEKGKPSTNIAKEVALTLDFTYKTATQSRAELKG